MSSHVAFLEPASQSAQVWGSVSQCLQVYMVLKWIHMMDDAAVQRGYTWYAPLLGEGDNA
jgi:hypothetical protein